MVYKDDKLWNIGNITSLIARFVNGAIAACALIGQNNGACLVDTAGLSALLLFYESWEKLLIRMSRF